MSSKKKRNTISMQHEEKILVSTISHKYYKSDCTIESLAKEGQGWVAKILITLDSVAELSPTPTLIPNFGTEVALSSHSSNDDVQNGICLRKIAISAASLAFIGPPQHTLDDQE